MRTLLTFNNLRIVLVHDSVSHYRIWLTAPFMYRDGSAQKIPEIDSSSHLNFVASLLVVGVGSYRICGKKSVDPGAIAWRRA